MLLFRHTLWRHLQGILSPLLARVLEVLDRDCNLGLLYGLSDGLVQFWLDIFQDHQLLELLFTQTARYIWKKTIIKTVISLSRLCFDVM